MMFNMKKTFATLLLLSFVFSFAGCANSSEPLYKSIVVDCANDGYDVSLESDPWSTDPYQKKNMKDQTVTFMGTSYTCPYKVSEVIGNTSYEVDVYMDENLIEFGINSKTGELCYINLGSREFLKTHKFLPDIENPYENAVLMAKEVASQYIDNMEEYTMLVDEPWGRSGEENGIPYEVTYYGITFVKIIKGYDSSDFVSMTVTSKGAVCSFMVHGIDSFEGAQLDFDPQLVEQSIAQKAEAVYQKTSFKLTDYRIQEQSIVCAPNGTIYMVSYVAVTGTSGDSGREISSGVKVLTVIGSAAK